MAAFTAQLPNVLGQLGAAVAGTTTAGTGLNASSRATITIGNKPFLERKAQKNLALSHRGQGRGHEAPAAAAAATLDASAFASRYAWPRSYSSADAQVDS